MTEPRPVAQSEVAVQARETSKPKAAGAGLGGVGAGTGLVAIAEAVGPSTPVGAVLIWLAPTVSFVTGLGFYYVQAQATRYFERRVVNNAKRTLEGQLENPKTSEGHKKKIRELLEELESTVANAELERVKLIGISQRSAESG